MKHSESKTVRLTSTDNRNTDQLQTDEIIKSQTSGRTTDSIKMNGLSVEKRKTSILGIGRPRRQPRPPPNESPASPVLCPPNAAGLNAEQEIETDLGGDSTTASIAISDQPLEPVHRQNQSIFPWKVCKRPMREMWRWKQLNLQPLNSGIQRDFKDASPIANECRSPNRLNRLFPKKSGNGLFSGLTVRRTLADAQAGVDDSHQQPSPLSGLSPHGEPSYCNPVDDSACFRAPLCKKTEQGYSNHSTSVQTANQSTGASSDLDENRMRPTMPPRGASKSWTGFSPAGQDCLLIDGETNHLEEQDMPDINKQSFTRNWEGRCASIWADFGISSETEAVGSRVQKWKRGQTPVSEDSDSPWGIRVARASSAVERPNHSIRFITTVLNARKNSVAANISNVEWAERLSGSGHHQSAEVDSDLDSPSSPPEMMQDDFIEFCTDSNHTNRKKRMFGLRPK